MKIKTAELTGAALDWAVARSLGKRPSMFIFEQTGKLAAEHNYSTDWNQGGPIIDREHISIDWMHRMVWDARIYVPDEEPWQMDGETMLIAAMRCFVASKLGDEVEIPEELLT